MTPRTRRAAKDYFENEQPAPGLSVFWSTDKTGSLTKQQFSLRAITGRVNELGKEIGIDNLSSHDCRHYWATNAAKFSPLNALKDAGGWRSFQMPLRYIAKAQISNKGVILEA
jgi:integrase